jgi:uncharacterized 2Fe-2S/4Fe-4S cluster protein (DUF4445 family)
MPVTLSFTVENSGKKTLVHAEDGMTLVEAARRSGLMIETPCGGALGCGKCRVKILNEGGFSALRPVHGEKRPLDAGDGGYALACSTAVAETGADCLVEILLRDYAGENRSLRIVRDGEGFSYGLSPSISKRREAGRIEVCGGGRLLGVEDSPGGMYALAVDIGTTTLAAMLVDLNTGWELASTACLNPQAAYAQDLISRIQAASSPEGLLMMNRLFTGAVNEMIANLTERVGVEGRLIYEAAFSGNTAMLHIAVNADPSSLGMYPYTAKFCGGYIPAERLGLALSPFAVVYAPPIISSYIGSDITSGILASGLADEAEKTILLIDIGTNGEIVLAKEGVFTAASTAAGPALEGMNIACGMRAGNGAIESFSVGDGRVDFNVIGGGEPRGICGSGLLDIAACLVRAGVIGESGRFVTPEEAGGIPETLKNRLGPYRNSTAFFITGDVMLTQSDVRQIQLAKGAIRCGIEILLKHAAVPAGGIDAVYIAGSFGFHLRESSLLDTGLLPRAFAGKSRFLGNTSLSGAKAFLLNKDFRAKMEALVKNIAAVDLAKDGGFEDSFVEHLAFPHCVPFS